jgi:hypothetical protein
LDKVYIDKLKKYRRLAHETETIRNMNVEIIQVVVSSLGTVYAQSLDALKTLLLCKDRIMKKIGRQLSEAAIAQSPQIWRGYAQNILHSENLRVNWVAAQEAMIASENLAIERANGDQEAKREQADDVGEGREGEEPHVLTDEIDVEVEQFEKEDEDEGEGEIDDEFDEGELHRGWGSGKVLRPREEAGHDEESTLDAMMEDFLEGRS